MNEALERDRAERIAWLESQRADDGAWCDFVLNYLGWSRQLGTVDYVKHRLRCPLSPRVLTDEEWLHHDPVERLEIWTGIRWHHCRDGEDFGGGKRWEGYIDDRRMLARKTASTVNEHVHLLAEDMIHGLKVQLDDIARGRLVRVLTGWIHEQQIDPSKIHEALPAVCEVAVRKAKARNGRLGYAIKTLQNHLFPRAEVH